eukprot:TRINITY_DN22833_c0_g1_i1.p1 TRINITY_DN22833_c0_g1~~TRINITY_DN22833_c0_g1_i1.p1  ORF type:complete len:311 (+),score=79.94 TRINITY_DN22833_c0_g1_i1:150-1082(+)
MGGCSPFVIEADEATRAREESGLSEIEYLFTLVKPTQMLARTPISNFHVGAVGLGESGRIFRGVNLEFEGLPLHHSVHAEQFLVANAAQHGEHKLKIIAVSAAPCGHCRQFLQEVLDATHIKLLIADSNAETQLLSYFLPHRFGPDDLDENTPLVFESHNNRLALELKNSPLSDPSLELCNGNGVEMETAVHNFPSKDALETLSGAALRAANMSHAPYSKCPSGVALMNSKGRVFTGFYIESAAYNPSLSPLQAAIVGCICEDVGNYEDIAHAVLVEKESAIVQQEDTIKLALKKIAPQCSFHLFHCSSN